MCHYTIVCGYAYQFSLNSNRILLSHVYNEQSFKLKKLIALFRPFSQASQTAIFQNKVLKLSFDSYLIDKQIVEFKARANKPYLCFIQMSKKQMTLVFYYVPQDQDDPQYPNVFGVMMSKANIRLKDIYDNFPLKGTYIFRFKVMYDNTVAWLDLPDLQAKLPTFKEKIFIKATRVGWDSDNPYGHYRITNKASTGLVNKNSTRQQDSPVIKKIFSVQSPKPKQQIDIFEDAGHGHGKNGDLI